MPKVTPEEGARKLIDRARAAAPHIADQVRKVTVSPTEAAASKIDKMRTNFLKAIEEGKVERGLRRVSLSDWQNAMINKGVPRISQGLEQAENKIIEFNRQFYPFLERVQGEVDAMPDTTLEDNIQRAVHNIRRISEFKRS